MPRLMMKMLPSRTRLLYGRVVAYKRIYISIFQEQPHSGAFKDGASLQYCAGHTPYVQCCTTEQDAGPGGIGLCIGSETVRSTAHHSNFSATAHGLPFFFCETQPAVLGTRYVRHEWVSCAYSSRRKDDSHRRA